MILYRLGNKCSRLGLPILPKFFDVLIRILHNSAVFSCTDIGINTIFAYGGIAVVIHKRTVIGMNCMVGSNVTIGGRSRSAGVPVIGDGVFIATGAKILGAINIGDNSVIGANAVVIHDVPANSVVAGIPAKVIKTNIDSVNFR
jgi:serine O-acetyltransferase